MFTWPPTPRAQTPPPGWSGAGSAGADTKALPCWVRKAVLTLPMAAEIAELVALVGIASVPILLIVVGSRNLRGGAVLERRGEGRRGLSERAG